MKTAMNIIMDKQTKMVCVAPDTTIGEALRMMVENKIGAILGKENDISVGIWTERDLMRNILEPGFDIETAKVGDYMSTPLYAVPHDAPIIKIEEKFVGLFVRHLLVEKDDEYIGLLSIGDVIRASLLAKDRQIRELNSIASWEYYENWGWDRRRGGKKK
ncbi:MAG: CBS domain-containing protein [Deltaproteobacteria bacterium]|nr:CBS domain-containing protein [Deltaproteobacteria bacterium]